jgi:antitoxin (DNA-binding transcriptional repressor) of toxin-antitoxin stability system
LSGFSVQCALERPTLTIGSCVHLRRAILLFALVLGLTALAAAVSPSRDTGRQLTAPPPAGPPAAAVARTVSFTARPSVQPTVRRVRAGEHVVVAVSSPVGGVVTIPRAGRTASVSPAAPARFDLLAPAPGRYDVLFATSGLDEPRRVGSLVTRP